MNQICGVAGFSERQIDDLTDAVASYFFDGPQTAGTPSAPPI